MRLKVETNSKEENGFRNKLKKINNYFTGDALANLTYASMIIIYFIFFSILSNTLDSQILLIFSNIASFSFLFFAIITIEVAYKKDENYTALHGVEFLVLAIFTLLMQYILKSFKISIQVYIIAGLVIFTIYYLLKTAILFTKEKRKELESYSDIKEIVKEDPIDRKTTRKNKKVN